jgi:SAM-dependent methyltransferase
VKTDWDYTELARHYASRPDYAPAAIDAILVRAGIGAGAKACDIGAGSAHLTIPLLERGLVVEAVEPNAEMRRLGQSRTQRFPQVHWFEGTGEATGRPDGAYAIVTFGSSFNVTDRPKALQETARLLRPRGWFACLWNHRDLDDPLQAAVEALIRTKVPEYGYGARREDQTEVIAASGLFEPSEPFEGRVTHRVDREIWIEAWRSHATLARQAGARMDEVVQAITDYVRAACETEMPVPYVTRGWIAQRRR